MPWTNTTSSIEKQQHVKALRRHLQAARCLRARVNFDPPAARQRLLLREWQATRLTRTHADLLASPRFGRAAQFFISDLYGPKDFSSRDEEVERILPLLIKMLPASALRTVRTRWPFEIDRADRADRRGTPIRDRPTSPRRRDRIIPLQHEPPPAHLRRAAYAPSSLPGFYDDGSTTDRLLASRRLRSSDPPEASSKDSLRKPVLERLLNRDGPGRPQLAGIRLLNLPPAFLEQRGFNAFQRNGFRDRHYLGPSIHDAREQQAGRTIYSPTAGLSPSRASLVNQPHNLPSDGRLACET